MAETQEAKKNEEEKKYFSLFDVEKEFLPNYYEQKNNEISKSQVSLIKNVFTEEMLKGIKV
ncbi:MAG: hypothetical protein ABFD50_16180 [Smithella sp.]